METRRLILRPFESEDAEAAFVWFGDPIVMRFTPAGPDTSIEQTKARLANLCLSGSFRSPPAVVVLGSTTPKISGFAETTG